MKRFCCSLLAFLAALAVCCTAVLALSATDCFRSFFAKITASTGYDRSSALEILPHIADMQTPGTATKLVLGDSVCEQLCNPFQSVNPTYCTAGSNRAITMSGQYLLAALFLQSHPAATDITLMLTPESFSSSFDANYGYQYAVIPFSEAGVLPLLDSETQAELTRAYGSFFVRPEIVRMVDYSPLNKKLYLNFLRATQKSSPGEPLNALSLRCLTELAALCDQKGVALHLVCAPTADTPERRAAVAALESAFTAAGLADRWPDFCSTVLYYPADRFRDSIHFGGDYTKMEYLAQVLGELSQKTGLLTDFSTRIP